MPTQYGEFQIYGYVNDITGEHHVALVKGEIGDGEDVLCRVHSECLTGDTFGSPLRLWKAAAVGDAADRERRKREFFCICDRREGESV